MSQIRRPSAVALRPRAWRIITHRNLWISVLAGFTYVVFSSFTSPFAPSQRILIKDVASATIGLTSFGFAIAIAAIALVVALPQSLMMRNMMLNSASDPATVRSRDDPGGLIAWVENETATEAKAILDHRQPSVFSNFVFTFLWTGTVQVGAAIIAFCCQLFAGASAVLTKTDRGGLVAGIVLVTVTIYALLQLLAALKAIGLLATNQEVYLTASVRWVDAPTLEGGKRLGCLETDPPSQTPRTQKAFGPNEADQ